MILAFIKSNNQLIEKVKNSLMKINNFYKLNMCLLLLNPFMMDDIKSCYWNISNKKYPITS